MKTFSIHIKKPGFCILVTLIIFMFFNKGRLAKQIVVIIDKRKRSLQQATLWNKVQNRTNMFAISFLVSIAGIVSCIVMFWLP